MGYNVPISAFAVIGDRHSCYLTDLDSTINWYCPGQFDADAIFSVLLDDEKGGYWKVEAEGKTFSSRAYRGRSSVLDTTYTTGAGDFIVTDFMPTWASFKGICRKFSKAPKSITNRLKIKPAYGQQEEIVKQISSKCIYLTIAKLWLSGSHELKQVENELVMLIPEGEQGWMILSDKAELNDEHLAEALQQTLSAWKKISARLNYSGVYEQEVQNSIRAVQQMLYEPTKGIIAAATTSLPEVLGGGRNYDYRYVWMRDTGLITAALVQIDTSGELEKEFLKFTFDAMEENGQEHVSCLYTIDRKLDIPNEELPLKGYQQSRPVLKGNAAKDQFQLDAEANILMAAKLIFDKCNEKLHWTGIEKLADFICKNWQREDNGIWEEEATRQYTCGKVFAALGLEYMAAYQDDAAKAERWLDNARQIRAYVQQHCLTSTGAYANYAGSEEVDISAIMFPIWSYDELDSERMLATVAALEKKHCRNNLYWRRLEEFDASGEGAFLAGSCWMAHYYAIAGNLEKSRKILDAVLRFSNDLGYFSEEGDATTGILLGNFPQTFVHSSFICAANGLETALKGGDSRIRN